MSLRLANISRGGDEDDEDDNDCCNPDGLEPFSVKNNFKMVHSRVMKIHIRVHCYDNDKYDNLRVVKGTW